MKRTWIAGLCLLLTFAFANVSAAETEGAAALENLKILNDKVKADKKLLVAANMDLSDTEASAFWPLYDEYQAEITKLNARLSKTIQTYATAYNGESLTDGQAIELLNEILAADADEVAMRKSFAERLAKVLPGIKAARYLQIEGKIRAIVRAGLVDKIPLVM